MSSLTDRWKFGDSLGKPLSPTEHRLLELVSGGVAIKRAAAYLGMERSTADTHISRAKTKLGAKTRYHAVAMFAALKLKEEI